MNDGDEMLFVTPSGGGYGDPLERDPELVLLDWPTSSCPPTTPAPSTAWCIDEARGVIDDEATDELRERAASRGGRRDDDLPRGQRDAALRLLRQAADRRRHRGRAGSGTRSSSAREQCIRVFDTYKAPKYGDAAVWPESVVLVSGRLAGKIAIVTGATEGHRSRGRGGVRGRGGPPRARGPSRASRASSWPRSSARTSPSFVGGDVADPSTADRAVETALERFGALDVLVNNAALDLSGVPLFDTTLERAREIFDVNVFGALAMQLACARVMAERGGGSIVNVTSRLGLVGLPGSAVYGASKGALHALTRGAAVEWARLGIRVN